MQGIWEIDAAPCAWAMGWRLPPTAAPPITRVIMWAHFRSTHRCLPLYHACVRGGGVHSRTTPAVTRACLMACVVAACTPTSPTVAPLPIAP